MIIKIKSLKELKSVVKKYCKQGIKVFDIRIGGTGKDYLHRIRFKVEYNEK